MINKVNSSPRFLLVEVISPHTHRDDVLGNFSELESLVTTFGGKTVEKIIQHRVSPDQATYIGSGKITQVQKIIVEKSIDMILLNAIVNSGQIFRLEKALWQIKSDITVWDRVDLILNIFERNASSTEAKLQIELAQLEHMGPRLYGLGRTLLSRQAGGIGTRGIGETNLELMKRHIKKRVKAINDKLDHIKQNREKAIWRRKNQGIATVSLVGYTNAGKTSLFNKLTGKDKLIRNSLFTTLDSCLGRLKNYYSGESVLVSDTIGFIDNLPPFLITAFKSTLMESLYADFLLHIIDCTDKKIKQKIKVVDEILQSLSIDERKIVNVFNKIDKLSLNELGYLSQRYLHLLPIFVSAHTGEGLDKLRMKVCHRSVYNNYPWFVRQPMIEVGQIS